MQLLITRSRIPHFYRIDQNELEELTPINFGEHEICTPTLSFRKRLPWEICSMIIEHLFDKYLTTHNYDLAAPLAWLNRSAANEIYDRIYGKSTISVTTKIKRVCNTMYFLERIHDDYFTMPRMTQYTACRVIKTGIISTFHPWDFILDCHPTSHYGVVAHDNEEIEQYEVGPLNGDLVWLTGKYLKDGTYDCNQFKHPILNLEICNAADLTTITSRYLRRNNAFKKFTDLLKKCYGPNMGLHVMFDDSIERNPFDMTHTGYIEF